MVGDDVGRSKYAGQIRGVMAQPGPIATPPSAAPPAPIRSSTPKKSRRKLYAIVGVLVAVAAVAGLLWYSIGPVSGNLLIGYSYTGASEASWSVSQGCGGNVPITFPNRNTGAAYTCEFTLTNHGSTTHSISSAKVTGTGYLSSMSPNLPPSGSIPINVPAGGAETVSMTFGCPLPPGQYQVSVEFILN